MNEIEKKPMSEANPVNEIGWAIFAMKDGRRVRRAGWNGKGMWLAYVDPSHWGISNDAPYVHGSDVANRLLPWIGMKTADGAFVPWLASQTDLLATDWELAE